MKDEIVNNWYEALCSDNLDDFLDFAEGLNINEFVIENGEKVVYLEDGNNYIAHGECIGKNDNNKAKEIIKALEECGVEFKEKE